MRPPVRPKKITAEQVRMHTEQGSSEREIALLYGVSRRYVRKLRALTRGQPNAATTSPQEAPASLPAPTTPKHWYNLKGEIVTPEAPRSAASKPSRWGPNGYQPLCDDVRVARDWSMF